MVTASIMESNSAKLNEMGNEVVEGYACKPKDFDPKRPIMHFKAQLLICDDERCAQAAGMDKAQQLREILKNMGLNQGESRIKISRTKCFGACRYRQVAEIVSNTQANGTVDNNALWLHHTHKYTKEQWIEIFQALRDNKSIQKLLRSEDFIRMKVYG